MWPHCPQDLWCHVICSGIFLVRPYLVVTSTYGSGTLWTISSPASSSSKSFSRTSSVGAFAGSGGGGLRIASSGMNVASVVMVGLLDLISGVFEGLFHDIEDDHVESFVCFFDHVHHV